MNGTRKIRRLLLTAAMLAVSLACLCSCGEKAEETEEPTSFELALVTDESGIDDGSFLETTWSAMQAFGEENGMTCQYYPSADNEDAYMAKISEAKDTGAKLVVLAGSQFETIAYKAQDKFPDLKFILIDGVPRDDKYNYDAGKNTEGVIFAEQEAGYMAGYAAVSDGYTKFGFMGGNDVPPVKKYGYGFIQGVSAAAAERNTSAEIKYTYLGTFDASDEIESESYEWYSGGTEVIFACGGSIGESVMAAAETAGGKVIGVDADQSSLSETVITSAKKETGKALTDILKTYKRNNFQGGAIQTYSAENGGVGLEMTNARFSVFTEEEYKQLLKEIKSGSRNISSDIENKTEKDMAGEETTVEIIKN